MHSSILEKYPLSELQDRYKVIAPYITKTTVLTSTSINKMVDAELFFKCENLQKVGAFKMRGAINALLKLKEESTCRKVVTHSSGNHAQALAKAASLLGFEAFIVMPKNAPKIKVNGVKALGGKITFCEPTLKAREENMLEIKNREEAVFIPPYDHRDIIIGQSSATQELLDEVPQLNAIMCPVGGGGLLAGTALAAKHYNPNLKVYASEPKGADDAYQSLKAGKLIPQTNPQTIADGLLTSLGNLNFEIIRELVDDIFCVSDEEITSAMRLIWERLKIIVEPSSATVLAAVIKNVKLFQNKKVGLILSGGNVDLDDYFASINNRLQ